MSKGGVSRGSGANQDRHHAVLYALTNYYTCNFVKNIKTKNPDYLKTINYL